MAAPLILVCLLSSPQLTPLYGEGAKPMVSHGVCSSRGSLVVKWDVGNYGELGGLRSVLLLEGPQNLLCVKTFRVGGGPVDARVWDLWGVMPFGQ